MAFLDQCLRQLIGHLGRGGVPAATVFEEERIIKFHFPAETQGLLEILLGFTGESHDNVRAHPHFRPSCAQFVDQFQKPIACVTSMHQLEHPIAAALHGQMGILHEFGQAHIGINQVIAVPFGMRGGKPDPLQPINFMHGLDQLHKSTLAVFHANLPFAIAVHNLAKQRHLLHAIVHEHPTFIDDVFYTPAPFAPARVGYNAKGAKLITALHDADKRRHRLGVTLGIGQMLSDGAFTAGFLIRIHHLIPASADQII